MISIHCSLINLHKLVGIAQLLLHHHSLTLFFLLSLSLFLSIYLSIYLFIYLYTYIYKDDRYFLSGSLDGKLRLWNIPDKKVALWNEIEGVGKCNNMLIIITTSPHPPTHTPHLGSHLIINVIC